MPVSLEVIDAAVEGGAAQIQAEKTIGLDTSVLLLYLSNPATPILTWPSDTHHTFASELHGRGS